ncbi:MAG: hypothetical protein QOE90_2403 [Thermoplasmata archaeon]|jgi:hypothetical protein|nr:hypothetical protein [Thermoplasmata archaeon]
MSLNLLSYFFNAVNVFNSDRPRHRRVDLMRSGRRAWTWAQRHPIPATVALGFVALLILFAWLAWGL